MNSKKVFYMMLGVFGLLCVLIVVSIVYGNIFLQKQSSKLVSLKLDNQVIDAQQKLLAQAKKDVQKYSELDSIAKQIVPQDKDQARATREIVSLAEQADIRIASITFPASTLGQTPPKPAAGTPAPSPVPVASSTVTQVKPVDGVKGLYQLDITVISDSTQPTTYPKLVSFLQKLEQNRRTAQVSQITIQPDAQNRSGLNFTLTVTVFIKP